MKHPSQSKQHGKNPAIKTPDDVLEMKAQQATEKANAATRVANSAPTADNLRAAFIAHYTAQICHDRAHNPAAHKKHMDQFREHLAACKTALKPGENIL